MLNKALEIAFKEYGNKGIPGSNSEKEVLKYYTDIGFKWVQDDDLAWCSAFMNWCLKKANLPYFKTLSARAMLKYGTKTEYPEIGDIVVLWRISKNSIYGHVGFFITEKKGVIYLLGGNQSNSVSTAPYQKKNLLEYRKLI